MTRSVAIIGLGSRGLGVLERIVTLASEPVDVHVIDPSACGAGVHETTQPDYLLLNTTCGQVSTFPDPLSVGADSAWSGPSLLDWAVARGLRLGADGFTVGPQGRELRPTDFLPRRLLGEYLGWFFSLLRQRAPAHVRIHVHRTTAVDLASAGVLLADGSHIQADYCFLTTGYTDNDAAPAAGRVATPYPLPAAMEPIEPGQTVAIGGFGLSAMDVLSCLTVGRGGRYRQEQGEPAYLPSGREPAIVLYSRTGVPCRARPQATRFEISYQPLVFTRAALDQLRRPAGFARDIMPLILTEMRIAYRRCQARCAGPEAEAALVAELTSSSIEPVLDKLDATLGPFDPAAHLDGSGEMRVSDSDAYQHWFAGVLRRDLGDGLLGFAWSPAKAALDIIRELRDTVRYAVDFGGLSDASDFYERIVPLMNRAVVGPQYERHAELLALMAAGVVRVPLGPSPAVRWAGGSWELSSTRLGLGHAVRADWLVPAQVPLPSVDPSASPLIRALAAAGRIRPFSASIRGIDVDRDQHPVAVDGTPDRRIWVLGPLCEGATFYNNLVPSPGVFSRPIADAHRCVTAMLAS